ncbi:unnamed protein product, partial [Nesidiocoris tenuis]
QVRRGQTVWLLHSLTSSSRSFYSGLEPVSGSDCYTRPKKREDARDPDSEMKQSLNEKATNTTTANNNTNNNTIFFIEHQKGNYNLMYAPQDGRKRRVCENHNPTNGHHQLKQQQKDHHQ